MSRGPGGRGPRAAADLAAGALAAIALAITWPRVSGFTTDSDAYLDVARNVLAGEGLVQRVVDYWRPTAPDPLGLWPPLYPLSVAGVGALGIPISTAARIVSAVAFLAFAIALGRLARRALPGRLAWTALAVGLLQPPVAALSSMAWSEPLYLALLTPGLLLLARLFEGGPAVAGGRIALGAGILFGLAGLARYAGWAAIPLGVASLLLARVPRRAVFLFAAGAMAPIVPWLLHNLLAFGAPFGPGVAAGAAGPAGAARALANALRWEFLPGAIAASTPVALIALLASVLAVAAAVQRGRASALRASAAYAALHLAVATISVQRFGINDLFGRYLVPALPFLWIAVLGGLAIVLRGPRSAGGAGAAHATHATLTARAERATPIVALAACVALFAFVLLDGGRFLRSHPIPPPEAAARAIECAELSALVRATEGPVLTDAGHGLRRCTERTAIEVPPPGFRVRPFERADLERWRAAGMRYALFAKDAAAEVDPALRARLVGPRAWARVDSSARFVLFRADS